MDVTFWWCVKAHNSVSKIVFRCSSPFLSTMFAIVLPHLCATFFYLIWFFRRLNVSGGIVSARRCAYRTIWNPHLRYNIRKWIWWANKSFIHLTIPLPFTMHTEYTLRVVFRFGVQRRANPIPSQNHKNSICETRVWQCRHRCAYHIRHECRACASAFAHDIHDMECRKVIGPKVKWTVY